MPMQFDPEVSRIGFTICATAMTTLLTIGKAFHSGINLLNQRIDTLSKTIAALDKNLAVQTAIFETHLKQERHNDTGN